MADKFGNPVIGVTEKGDAGINLEWADALPGSKFDCAILITKNLTDKFIARALELHEKGFPFIVHAGCTGLGGTIVEPNVPTPTVQLRQLAKLLAAGFPIERIVLRIDPVIPTEYGLRALRNVLEDASKMFDDSTPRIRISIMDDYAHAKERFRAAGLDTVYPDGQFYADAEQMESVLDIIRQYPQFTFETCAEPWLKAPNVEHVGCVSTRDLDILQISMPGDKDRINPQNRTGCLCLMGKREILTHKRQCPHKCLYCYWRDDA